MLYVLSERQSNFTCERQLVVTVM